MSSEDEPITPLRTAHIAPWTGVEDLDAIIASYLSDIALSTLLKDTSASSHSLLAPDGLTWYYNMSRRTDTSPPPYQRGALYRMLWYIICSPRDWGSRLPVAEALDRTAVWVDGDANLVSRGMIGYYAWHIGTIQMLHGVVRKWVAQSDDGGMDLPAIALRRGCMDYYDLLCKDTPTVIEWSDVIRALDYDPTGPALGGDRHTWRTRPVLPTLHPIAFRRFYDQYWVPRGGRLPARVDQSNRRKVCIRILTKSILYSRYPGHMDAIMNVVYTPVAPDGYEDMTAELGMVAFMRSPLRCDDDTTALVQAYHSLKESDPNLIVTKREAIIAFMSSVGSKQGAKTYIDQLLSLGLDAEVGRTLVGVYTGDVSLYTTISNGPRLIPSIQLMYVYIVGWYARHKTGADPLVDRTIQWIVSNPTLPDENGMVSRDLMMNTTIAEERHGIVLAAARSPRLVAKLYPSYGPLGKMLTDRLTNGSDGGRLVYTEDASLHWQLDNMAKLILTMAAVHHTHPKSLEYVVDLALPLADGIDVPGMSGTALAIEGDSRDWYVRKIQVPILGHIVALSAIGKAIIVGTRGELMLRQLLRFLPRWATSAVYSIQDGREVEEAKILTMYGVSLHNVRTAAQIIRKKMLTEE